MPENETDSFEPLDGIEFKSPREAADFLSYAGPDDLVEVKYIKDGETLPENETVTPERAARDLTAFHNANVPTLIASSVPATATQLCGPPARS